jgi:DNA-binding MarR family transcriptional regulator
MDGFRDAFDWNGGLNSDWTGGGDWTGLAGGTGALLADPRDRMGGMRDEDGDALGGIEPLPAADLLSAARRMATARRVRDQVFGFGLFLNPGWNILLELFVAGEEGRNVTIKSACVAACVPQSTALRHIAHLIDVRLAIRAQHPSDARSAYLKLTDRGRTRMVAFLTLSEGDRSGSGA